MMIYFQPFVVTVEEDAAAEVVTQTNKVDPGQGKNGNMLHSYKSTRTW
jgi:hypothetical protein